MQLQSKEGRRPKGFDFGSPAIAYDLRATELIISDGDGSDDRTTCQKCALWDADQRLSMVTLKQIVEANARHYLPILDTDVDAAGSIYLSEMDELVGDHLPKVMPGYGNGGLDARKFHALKVERFDIVVNVKEISQSQCTFRSRCFPFSRDVQCRRANRARQHIACDAVWCRCASGPTHPSQAYRGMVDV